VALGVAASVACAAIVCAGRWSSERNAASSPSASASSHELLREALNAANGVVSQMARGLGIARTTLTSRLDALGLRASKNTDG
jgi:transcriptional regulator of acetoin/glycerol metabolism